MAVPLLPHYLMAEMYEQLLQETFRFRRDAKFRQFQKFKDYIRNYWASKDFTELSVFGLDKQTNNDVESYHYQFNTLVEVKHPGAFDFADCVNEMLFNYCNEFDKLIANPGVPIVRPKRPEDEATFAKLKQEERLTPR